MKGKNKFNQLKSGYFKIPDTIFDYNLSTNAVALYVYFLTCSEKFNPSMSVMGRYVKLSNPTLIKTIKELTKKKLILKLEDGFYKKVNRYKLI